MRMWMIPAPEMCDQHLLGEHGEIHKHLPSFRRGVSVAGRYSPVVQIELCSIVARHDELAAEIDRRAAVRGHGGHHSPLLDVPDFAAIYPDYYTRTVDVGHSRIDLAARCEACASRINTN